MVLHRYGRRHARLCEQCGNPFTTVDVAPGHGRFCGRSCATTFARAQQAADAMAAAVRKARR